MMRKVDEAVDEVYHRIVLVVQSVEDLTGFDRITEDEVLHSYQTVIRNWEEIKGTVGEYSN